MLTITLAQSTYTV